jgi:hypothetical protein
MEVSRALAAALALNRAAFGLNQRIRTRDLRVMRPIGGLA